MHIYFDNYIIGILDSKYQNLTTFKTNPFSIFYICKLPREQLKLILKFILLLSSGASLYLSYK